MHPDEYFVPFAQSAYDAYGEVTDHKNYQGLPMPKWEELTPRIQQAWVGAVKDVVRKLNVVSVATGESFVEPSANPEALRPPPDE
jgi:hypothetical protein